MNDLCWNINHQKGEKPETFHDGRNVNGKNHGQGFGMNKAPLSHVIASGSQEGLSNAGPFLPAPGSEGRVNRIWHLQTRKNYMGLFILTRSPGFQQICTINALFRFPSLFFFFFWPILCEHPLASLNFYSSKLHLELSLEVCSLASHCSACNPRVLR